MQSVQIILTKIPKCRSVPYGNSCDKSCFAVLLSLLIYVFGLLVALLGPET